MKITPSNQTGVITPEGNRKRAVNLKLEIFIENMLKNQEREAEFNKCLRASWVRELLLEVATDNPLSNAAEIFAL